MHASVIPQVCPRCRFEPETFVNNCPQCGQVILSPKRVRVLGWVMFWCGAILTVGMVWLSLVMARTIAHSDDPGATTHFTGDANDVKETFAIFGMVFLFGIVAIVTGVWQVWHGRQNLKLVGFVMFLGILLLAAASLAQYVM